MRSLLPLILTMLLGGRIHESREQIHSAHEGSRSMGLNDSNFDAFVNHFREALTEVGVAPEPLAKVMALLESTRSAVLKR